MSDKQRMIIWPRFNDTDALGHVNNATFLTWLEEARRPIFEIFVPDLDVKKWNLIVAKVEISYLLQTDYAEQVEVLTAVQKIGNSSFTLHQSVSQSGKLCAEASTVLVHFDYSAQRSIAIPDPIREKLQLMLQE